MNSSKPDFSAALLAHLSSTGDLADQRARALAGIAAEQRNMRRQRMVTQAFWVACVALSVLYFWFDAGVSPAARPPFLAGFFLFLGGFEVVKHRIHAAKLDVLREVKLLQLQILELKAADQGQAVDDASFDRSLMKPGVAPAPALFLITPLTWR